MAKHEPQPVTTTHELLVQVRDELRALNAHFGGAEPSGPVVADGLTVTGQPAEPFPPANVEHGEQPDPLAPPPGPVGVDETLYCVDCDRTFTSQSGLSRHRQAKHEEG